MSFYNHITFLFLIFTNIICANNYEQEYKIEVLIYKNSQINTSETFLSELDLPEDNIIKLYQDNDSTYDYSNFSNISNFFKTLINDDDILKSYPTVWFREDEALNTLSKLKNNISKDTNLEILSAKSWIQTIPGYDSSKFLNYNDLNNNYNFYLKLYKKRFMHMHVMSYINDELNIYINEEQRIFNEEIYLLDHPHFGLIISINKI